MHESEENKIISIVEFKIFVGLVFLVNSGKMFPLHLLGPGLGPWRVKS